MKTVQYSIKFEEKASRAELFIRWFWMIPTMVVAMVLSFIGCMAMGFQWLHILFTGKRNKMLHEWSVKYMAYVLKADTYFLMLTDERSPIMPED